MPSLHDRYSKIRPADIRAERNQKKQAEQYVKDQEYNEARYDAQYVNQKDIAERKATLQQQKEDRELSKQERAFRTTELRKQRLAEKKEERELRKQEREEKYPTQTYAKKRATAFAEHFLSRAQDVPEKAKGEISSRIQKMKTQAKAPRVSRVRYPHEPGQSTRLPVFAPATGMGAGVAEETSRPAQPILQPQQQQTQFFGSKPMELFASRPQQDILGSGKQYDLGLGSNLLSGNGNKKKKEVRYY